MVCKLKKFWETRPYRIESLTFWLMDNKTIFLSILIVDGRWTTHGIWPTLNRGRGPFFCDWSNPFDSKQLETISAKLASHWTVIHQNSAKDYFWNHEWTKHGTCAMQLSALNSQFKYFNKGILRNKKLISDFRNRQENHAAQ
jgi:hypothetical protein